VLQDSIIVCGRVYIKDTSKHTPVKLNWASGLSLFVVTRLTDWRLLTYVMQCYHYMRGI